MQITTALAESLKKKTPKSCCGDALSIGCIRSTKFQSLCDTKEEELVFEALAWNVKEATRKEDVMEIFDILSGKKDVKNATPHVPESLKHLCETSEASNNGWKK